ncbi:MAG: peptidylprolyl isomerase [Leptospirales bacterium]
MKKIQTPLSIALLTALPLFFASCNQSTSTQSDELAKVGDISITKTDLTKKLGGMGLNASKDPNVTSELLNQMVDNSLLVMEARKEGLDKTPEFRRKLNSYENQLLRKSILKKDVDSKVKVSDADITAYYTKHQKEIRQPGYVVVRQVIFPSESIAKKMAPRLKRKGAFSKTIKTFSGGPVGKLYEGTVPPKFISYFFGVPAGSVTGPVTLKDGVHYFKIDQSVQGVQLTMEQARDGIRNYLSNQQNKSLYQALVNHLRSTTTVKINNKALVSMIAAAAAAKGSSSPVAPPDKK